MFSSGKITDELVWMYSFYYLCTFAGQLPDIRYVRLTVSALGVLTTYLFVSSPGVKAFCSFFLCLCKKLASSCGGFLLQEKRKARLTLMLLSSSSSESKVYLGFCFGANLEL